MTTFHAPPKLPIVLRAICLDTGARLAVLIDTADELALLVPTTEAALTARGYRFRWSTS